MIYFVSTDLKKNQSDDIHPVFLQKTWKWSSSQVIYTFSCFAARVVQKIHIYFALISCKQINNLQKNDLQPDHSNMKSCNDAHWMSQDMSMCSARQTTVLPAQDTSGQTHCTRPPCR